MATTVLVIDDEAPIRLLCRVNLEAEGMHVLEAADGLSGLEKARTETPDVVLLDVMMPMLDGWTVLRKIRSNRAVSDVPVIVVTGLGAEAAAHESGRLGVATILHKPILPSQVMTAVREVFATGASMRRDQSR
jgi:DNA-binding response OmpR family regulator